jgi:adenylate cyclase
LVEFASVVDAIRCAAEVQTALAESNAPLPQDRRIEFRIGINVGDIAFSPAEGDLVLQKPYRLERLAASVAEALRRENRRRDRSRHFEGAPNHDRIG